MGEPTLARTQQPLPRPLAKDRQADEPSLAQAGGPGGRDRPVDSPVRPAHATSRADADPVPERSRLRVIAAQQHRRPALDGRADQVTTGLADPEVFAWLNPDFGVLPDPADPAQRQFCRNREEALALGSRARIGLDAENTPGEPGLRTRLVAARARAATNRATRMLATRRLDVRLGAERGLGR